MAWNLSIHNVLDKANGLVGKVLAAGGDSRTVAPERAPYSRLLRICMNQPRAAPLSTLNFSTSHFARSVPQAVSLSIFNLQFST
jgi:hypothetical protein